MRLLIIAFAVLLSVNCFAQNLKTYEIQPCQQNFNPLESPLPKFGTRFDITAILDSTCFYSYSDWKFDRDWFDWNKLKGVTAAFSANNRNTVMVGWRPSNIDNFMVLTPYINTRKGKAKFEDRSSGFVVECNKPFTVDIRIYSRQTQFTFKQGDIERKYTYRFKRPFPTIWREVGTWIGGENNDPYGQPFGGAATQYMKIEARIK